MPELPEVQEIIHSGLLSYGYYCKLFEALLKDYFGTPYVIVTSTHSNAINVATAALGIGNGEDVIMSPMACLASTQPLLALGMNIIWADVDNHRGTLCPDSVIETITEKTKCIIHNHFCGYPGYVDDINLIAKEHGVPIIDDGIECFGSEYKGEKVGCTGADAAVFSLTAIRIPNTIDGGVVVFKDKQPYEKSLLIRDCGIDRSIFRDDIGEISPYCDIPVVGYPAMMNEVSGYIGCMQMEQVTELIASQRRNALRWDSYFASCRDCEPIERTYINPNYWVYGVLTNDKRKTIMSFRERGFYASGVHFNNSLYSVFGSSRTLKGAEDFNKRFVALPCGWWLSDDDWKKV